MAMAIAIISPVVVFVIVLLVFHRINERTHIFQQPQSLPWLYIAGTVIYSAMIWLSFFIHSPMWFMVPLEVVSTMFAGILLVSVTNWRGWGERLWKSPAYSFPHDRRLRVIALFVSSFGLASDAVLLIILLAR